MDRALKMGQISASGSFRLFLGKILSTVILALGTILLTILISEGDYGLYTIALVPAATIALFQDWGVRAAMTKYCANWRSMNKEGELRNIILAGMTFEVATGLTLTVFSLLIADFVATSFFVKPQLTPLITIICFSILFNSVLSACQSVFAGFERMGLSSFATVCQAITQGVLSPFFVYFGYGAIGAAIGYTISSVVVSIIVVILLYSAIFRKLVPSKTKVNLYETLKPLVRYGVPLSLGGILTGFSSQLYWFLMGSYVDSPMVGSYRVALNFAVLLTFLSIPISTVLFPAFSKIDQHSESQLLKTVFASSVKYTCLFLVPATMAIMVLSKPLIGTIYGDKWLSSSLFLTLFVISNLFAVFGNLSNTSLLAAMGETKTLLKLNAIFFLIAVPLGILLIPTLGILGVIVGAIMSGASSGFVGLVWTWRHYRMKADFRASAKIFFSSAIATGATYLFLCMFNSSDLMRLIVGSVLFLAIYMIVMPLVGGINQIDINNLRTMFSGLWIISKLLEIPLLLVERTLRIRATRTKVGAR